MPGRLPRHVIPGGLHEITFRCHQSRLLLRPDPKLNAIFKGCLAKAQQAKGLEIIWVVALSNHVHALVRPTSHTQLAEFLCHFRTNLSKEVCRLRNYPGGIFAGVRADVAPVTDEETAQVKRLLYLLAQGVKEGLCPNPWSWLGVHCADAIRAGKLVLEGGVWTDRTALFHEMRNWQRSQGKKKRGGRSAPRFRPREAHYQETLEVELSKLPCWEEMSDAEYCEALCELMDQVVEQYREQIERLPEDWRRRILSRVPTTRPEKTKRGPRVLVHAASKRARQDFREMLKAWLEQYWRASERLRSGCMEALKDFPSNSFPPSLPGSLVADN